MFGPATFARSFFFFGSNQVVAGAGTACPLSGSGVVTMQSMWRQSAKTDEGFIGQWLMPATSCMPDDVGHSAYRD